MPLVSVVMPVYNAAPFLEEAIKSVLRQSFKDFEFILINDGSTDESGNIIKGFEDERISYHYQPNAGVAATLNAGIQLAKGKYIWRHDADDTSLPNKLGKQVEFLEANASYALCATQIAFMTEAGKIAYKFRQPRNSYFNDSSFVEVQREHFNPYSPITHATVLIRKDVLMQLGGFRTEFKTAEDVDLWLRLIQHHKAVVLNDCSYFVRLNKTSITQVHGWKNEFFRNLAFQYYDQREKEGVDDLQKGLTVILPTVNLKQHNVKRKGRGKNVRTDILGFLYPLHLNAGDWKAVYKLVKFSLAAGWKASLTYKYLLFPVLGKEKVAFIVKLKNRMNV